MTGALIYVRLQTGGIPTFWAIMCVIAIEDCRSDGVLHLESAIWNLGYGICYSFANGIIKAVPHL